MFKRPLLFAGLDASARPELSKFLVLLMVLGAASGSTGNCRAQASTELQGKNAGAPKSAYRLSENVLPQKYDLLFSPEAQKGVFTGKESIDLEIKAPTSVIVMNSLDLKVANAQIVSSLPGAAPVALQVKYEPALERITFTASRPIAPGKYSLECNFNGILNDKLVGFYRSSFKDKKGKTHFLATTQMEPSDARRMFPCFDEPAMKASFKIRTLIGKDLVAISNGAVEKESEDKVSGKKLVAFVETPRMSSYLVALCVGEFKSTEPITEDGVEIRVWSVERDPALGNYARDYAGKILKFQNSYFQIKYPWGKLDLIAIPDFQAGAMENPGAITFREKLIVIDEKNASLDAKQSCVSVTAHEMAHQWFGDLVTMKWWDDIWLNEAFATWMARKTMDNVAPEWNVMSNFYSSRQGSMRTDSLHATRSIQSPVVKPSDALQMFDEITYVKGGSILRMLEVFISEKTFQSGVVSYLKAHSFGNASTADLWSALQAASGKPVKNMMQTWCKQPGYPLMTIAETKPGNYQVSQRRFFQDGEKSGKQTWMVPLAMRAISGKIVADEYGRETVKTESVQVCGQSTQALSVPGNKKGFFANSGGVGFYRTQYPLSVHKQILDNLASLSAGERLAFLADQQAMAIAGNLPVDAYLDTLKAYKNEQDLGVWETMIKQIDVLDLYVDKTTSPAYAGFIRGLLKQEFDLLGWEEKSAEAAPVKQIRGAIIGTLGTLGQDKEVIARARKMFAEYLKKPESVPADLLDAITNVVAYNGSKKDFDDMKALFKASPTPEVEQRNLEALAAFRQASLTSEVHKMILSKEIRPQDSFHVLSSLFSNPETKQLSWTFLKAHYSDLKKLYNQQVLGRLASYPGSFTSQAMYNDVQSFFATHRVPEGESDKNRMLERMSIHVKFNQRSGKALNAWLRSNSN